MTHTRRHSEAGNSVSGGNIMTDDECYASLLQHHRQTAAFRSCQSVLHWDRETYMPRAAAGYRAEQVSALAGLVHTRDTDERVGVWLAQSEAAAGGRSSAEATNIREWRRAYDRLVKVPQSLVEETARVTSMANQAWIDAREHSDFTSFSPWLQQIVQLKCDYARCIDDGSELYDVLLDDYEPGLKAAAVAAVFDELRTPLAELVGRITSVAAPHGDAVNASPVAADTQRAFAVDLAGKLGFDLQSGRIDTVVHPFCTTLGPNDVRVTTRWDENDIAVGLFGVIHEVGHGLYEQGLPAKHWGTPAGSAVSLGIHESQSRLWENHVARSQPFWRYFFPEIKKRCGTALDQIGEDAFVKAINHVAPSFIRVEADEVTYTLHIILRFEIERALVSGALAVDDVPAAWNETFRDLLGPTVPNDAHGCLQDVHWSLGCIGYFPTYALGNLYAAQFYDAAANDIGNLDEQTAAGDFTALLAWLRKHIHAVGMTHRSADLVRTVTGTDLSARSYLNYLRAKYGSIAPNH